MSQDEGESEEGEDDNDDDDEVQELDPKHHPLLRPGAMPRMSRAAVEAVVGMVEQDLMGGRKRAAAADSEDEDEEAVARGGRGGRCAAAGAGFGGFVPGGTCAAEGGCLWDGCCGFAA